MKTKYDYIGEIVAYQIDRVQDERYADIRLAVRFCEWYQNATGEQLYANCSEGESRLNAEHTAFEAIYAIRSGMAKFESPLILWDGCFRDRDSMDIGEAAFSAFVEEQFQTDSDKEWLYAVLDTEQLFEKFDDWYGKELTDEQWESLAKMERGLFFKDWEDLARNL